jgi:hypothetical protein
VSSGESKVLYEGRRWTKLAFSVADSFSNSLTCIRSKVLDSAPASVDDLPIWNYDGSSTGQAPGHDSEVLLK